MNKEIAIDWSKYMEGLTSKANVDLDNLSEVGKAKLRNVGGLEILDVGIAPFGINEAENKRRYLNGQTILQSQFKVATKKIKDRALLFPNLLCTEEEFEAEMLLSAKGQCGKFVVDNNKGTIRLPRVVNIQGLLNLQNAGLRVEAGLPNITAYVPPTRYQVTNADCTGAIYHTLSDVSDNDNGPYTNKEASGFNFDASRSNPIYGNSTTVQEEAIQYPYFIQLATGVIEIDSVVNEYELNNPYSLFDCKWSDHKLNNLSWLLSEGQWNTKADYPTAFDELLKEYNSKSDLPVKKSDETFTDYDFVINVNDKTFRLPIKAKLTGSVRTENIAPVKGTGKTLGLTNETNNFGLVAEANSNLSGRIDAYNQKVGGNINTGSQVVPGNGVGVTTDSSKSGIEADLSNAIKTNENLYLYYYIGETIQNANIINAGNFVGKLNEKTNLNLSNSTAITNCITEIPQDIKLELNNGTLTLKAGSKVYVPNGVDVFDVVITSTDLQYPIWAGVTETALICVSGNELIPFALSTSTSGTVPPTSGLFYDTTNNKVRFYKNSAITVDNMSLPTAIVKFENGKPTEIKQVFNGFGYIGSTMFSLPGVKGLAPRGRNKDGSLKNEFFTKTKVETYTFTGSATANCKIQISSAKTASANMDTVNWKYDEKANYITYKGIIQSEALIGNLRVENSKITRFEVPNVFRPLDYNDKSTITSWGIPDYEHPIATRVNLPANSFVDFKATQNCLVIVQSSTGNDNFVSLNNTQNEVISFNRFLNTNCTINGKARVAKGKTIKIKANGTSERFYTVFPLLESEA